MDWYIWALIFSALFLIIAIIGSIARKDWEKGVSFAGTSILLLFLLMTFMLFHVIWS